MSLRTALGAYSLITAALYLPALARMGDAILGPGVGAGIPIWQYWWVSGHFLGSLQGPLLQTTHLLHPVGTPLLWESPLLIALGSMLAVPLGPHSAYNALYLASFPAAGTALYALAKQYRRSTPAAFAAGAAFMFCPPMLTQHLLGQIPETLLFAIPLLLLVLERASLNPSPRNLIGVGAAAALACGCSPYIGFAAALTTAVWAAADPRRRNLSRLCTAAFAGAAPVAVFAYFPIVLHAGELTGDAGLYSASLLSWIDPLAWHPLAVFDRTGVPLEERSVFLALSVPLLTFAAWKDRKEPLRLLLTLAAAAAVLALGPKLRIAYTETSIPLPYALIDAVPGLSLLRAPARLGSVFWMAASLLSAAGLDACADRFGRRWGRLAPACFAIVFAFEMGLPWAVTRTTPIAADGVYALIAASAGTGSLLELPVALSKSGSLSLNAQTRMLAAPRHRRPLVAGQLARIPSASLTPMLQQPLLVELTHPHVLLPLESRPALRARREMLRSGGRESLRSLGIEWIIHHRADPSFTPAVHDAYGRILDETLGAPVRIDHDGRRLYHIPRSF